MRILFVQRVKAYAGSERYFTSIVPELIRKGIYCKLLLVVHPDDMEKLGLMRNLIEQSEIPCEFVVSKRKLSLKLLRRLNRIAKADQYDLIHVHLIHAEFWFALIRRWLNKSLTIVSTIHGFDEKYQAKFGFDPSRVVNNLYVRILKFNERQISKYHAVSMALKNLMVKAVIIPEEKISVIYYGFGKINANTEPTPDGVDTILVPGRLIAYKGQDHVLHALPEVIRAIPNVQCQFAGDYQGDFGMKLQSLSHELGISDHVKFLGHVDDIESYYNASKIIVLSSRSEGFGLVLMEAFNAERPVIAFDVPAFNEVIENEKTGLLCKPFDEKELSANMIRLLKDTVLREILVSNAKKKLRSDFSIDRMVSETIKFYESAISGRS